MRTALAVLFAMLLLTTSAVRADEQFPRASVSTSGESTVYVQPDEVVVTFGVETFDQNLDKAKQQNDAASAKLVKAVKAAGVEEKHLQIDMLSVELRYNDGNHPVRGIEGYYTRRFYCATLKDVKLLDKLIDTILKNGATSLGGLEFRTTELRKHRDAARKMAIKAAKEKAELLAGELGAKVGGPRSISEGAAFSGYFGGQLFNGNSTVGQNAIQMGAGGGGADGGDGETTPLGQIAVRATVSVTFDLK